MIKGKLERLFRRIKRNWRPLFLMWLPAGIIVVFLGTIFYSVTFSTDTSFIACTRRLPVCVGENSKFLNVLKCSYQTAWCDVKAIWGKATGKVAVSDLPGLPPVDEKTEKELFEKLTSDEFLEKRFEEFKQQEENGSPEQKDLKEYMEKVRAERVSFEKEMIGKREKMLSEQSQNNPEENNLSGQTEK